MALLGRRRRAHAAERAAQAAHERDQATRAAETDRYLDAMIDQLAEACEELHASARLLRSITGIERSPES